MALIYGEVIVELFKELLIDLESQAGAFFLAELLEDNHEIS